MPPLLDDWSRVAVEVELWRDYDPVAQCLPDMSLGRHQFNRDSCGWVCRLFADGVGCARIAEPVELCAGASAHDGRTLVLIRELTGRGIAVDWVARCGDGCVATRRYHHLFPPVQVVGAAQPIAKDWQDTFYAGKCLYRRGPGFAEVRDRRSGKLEMLTLDEPRRLDAIELLLEGVAAESVDPDVRGDFADAGLLAEQAGHLWWLPTRVYRWPFPALLV